MESINSSDLALLLDARADIEYVRVRTPQGPKTVDKLEFLSDAAT